jgi:hypothetical protein
MIKIAVLALILSGAARAAEPAANAAVGPPAPKVYGLTEAQKAEVLESASLRPDADNPALLPALPQDRHAHGEVGMMIGTGGARGIYGVVGVPISENASAVLSFSNSQSPGYGYGSRYGSRYGSGPYGGGAFGAPPQQSFGFGIRQQGW